VLDEVIMTSDSQYSDEQLIGWTMSPS